eukprot:6201874-Pleurochrysis_carterae.AAC.1
MMIDGKERAMFEIASAWLLLGKRTSAAFTQRLVVPRHRHRSRDSVLCCQDASVAHGGDLDVRLACLACALPQLRYTCSYHLSKQNSLEDCVPSARAAKYRVDDIGYVCCMGVRCMCCSSNHAARCDSDEHKARRDRRRHSHKAYVIFSVCRDTQYVYLQGR